MWRCALGGLAVLLRSLRMPFKDLGAIHLALSVSVATGGQQHACDQPASQPHIGIALPVVLPR